MCAWLTIHQYVQWPYSSTNNILTTTNKKWSYTIHIVVFIAAHLDTHTNIGAHAYHISYADPTMMMIVDSFSVDGSLVHPLVFGISLTYTVHAHWIAPFLSLTHSLSIFSVLKLLFSNIVIIVAVCLFHTPQVQAKTMVRSECIWVCVKFVWTLRKTNGRLCIFIHSQSIFTRRSGYALFYYFVLFWFGLVFFFPLFSIPFVLLLLFYFL